MPTFTWHNFASHPRNAGAKQNCLPYLFIFFGDVGGNCVIHCLNRWCFFLGGYYLKLAFLGRILVNMHGVRNADRISRECCSHLSAAWVCGWAATTHLICDDMTKTRSDFLLCCTAKSDLNWYVSIAVCLI